MNKRMNEQIWAIIVLWKPEAEQFRRCLGRILPQITRLVVVDNGENSALGEKLDTKVSWIANPLNNLARAQNMGIEAALAGGARWVLLLDDDSLPAEDYVAQLLKAAHGPLAKARPPVAMLGGYIEEQAFHQEPYSYKTAWGLLFRRCYFDGPVIQDVWFVPASGTLIDAAYLRSGARMDEEFAIYNVDTDFCLAARRAGYQIATVRDARLQHRYGNRRVNALGISTTNHSARMRYYMFRNRKRLWWRYGLWSPAFVLWDMLRAMSEMLRILMMEEDKAEKIRAINCALLNKEFT